MVEQEDVTTAASHVVYKRLNEITDMMTKILDEMTALRICLEAGGAIRREQLLAQLHKMNFDQFLHKHPCSPSQAMQDTLCAPEVLELVVEFAGLDEVNALSITSRNLRRGCSLTVIFVALICTFVVVSPVKCDLIQWNDLIPNVVCGSRLLAC